jgi:maltooligosyltrehalose trehalohydrolase
MGVMNLLPLEQLGGRQDGRTLRFGLFLPGVSPQTGHQLSVRVIHEHDQFLQDIDPVDVPMSHRQHPVYGDLWQGSVDLDAPTDLPDQAWWGRRGQYVYRYAARRPDGELVDWILDPCAREFGVGKMSAVTVDYEPYSWSDAEASWRVPRLEDLVMYELHLREFAGSVDDAVARLDYLADLGVNCLSLMPLTNITDRINWGYEPVAHFGVDERLGRRRDVQKLVDEAHQRGLAIVVDAVYGHVSSDHAYSYAYRALGYGDNPFLGDFAANMFGESTDFRRPLTRDMFFTVNVHWLDAYHVDGFRYDCVPNYWDGPVGDGYAPLTYHTYRYVIDRRGDGDYWQRFFDGDRVNLIQCAEFLDEPVKVLQQSYSTCAWQNWMLDTAKAVTAGSTGLGQLGLITGAGPFPSQAEANGEVLPKAPLQYLETHDHSRFVAQFGIRRRDEHAGNLFDEGVRANWFKLQPYLIALLTAEGVPMLWQGQELCENYVVPGGGWGRIGLERPLRWEYFYDHEGRGTVQLVRRLLRIRRNRIEFRRRGHFFYGPGHEGELARGVLLFSRSWDSAFSLVALNFSPVEHEVDFSFEKGGHYDELLHNDPRESFDVASGGSQRLHVPSNYGRIWGLRS